MAGVISSVASLLAAVVWPITVFILSLIFRKEIIALVAVATRKFEDARRVKIGGLEFESFSTKIEEIATGAGASASSDPKSQKIPREQFQAAEKVEVEVRRAHLPRPAILSRLLKKAWSGQF